MTQKYLGKIGKVEFGTGGYQGSMLGVTFQLEGDHSMVCDFWGTWNWTIERTERTKWTEQDRSNGMVDMLKRLSKIMDEAKVGDVYKLKGVPVEIEIEGNTLKSWRVLTEVL